MERPSSPAAAAILVAAGRSTRMRAVGGARKPLLELDGRSILEHACAALDACTEVRDVVVVTHEDDLEDVAALASQRPAFAKVRAVLPGGEERVDSVRVGAAAPEIAFSALLAVHDAARPLVTPEAVGAVLTVAARDGAALLAVPVTDTLKVSSDGERIEGTVDRDHLWAAQTPQAFEARRFRELLAEAEEEGFLPTDDAALWERYVGPVTIVPGQPAFAKITRPGDLELARAMLELRQRESTA